MTVEQVQSREQERAGVSRTTAFAVMAVAVAAVLAGADAFTDIGDSELDGLTDWLWVLGASIVVAAVVFGLVVRHAPLGTPGLRSLVLGVLGLAALPLYWSGLPVVLSIGAIACAVVAREVRGGSMPVRGALGVICAEVALGLTIYFVVT